MRQNAHGRETERTILDPSPIIDWEEELTDKETCEGLAYAPSLINVSDDELIVYLFIYLFIDSQWTAGKNTQ